MQVPIKKLQTTSRLPEYAHAGDAGMDLFANTNLTIAPRQRALVPTGIALAIPAGYVGLVWDKSGLATKHGITTLAGVIDAGYRGEVQVAIFNSSDALYTVMTGQKIAQLLIQPIIHAELMEQAELPAADRGDRGFGSTGL